MSTLCAGHLPTIGDAQHSLKKLTDNHTSQRIGVWGWGYLRPASGELAQRRRACSEKYDTATRAAPAIFFKKNSEKLTCIEGLSLSLTRSRTPKIPKRKGTLTIKPAKRVESFVFIALGICRWCRQEACEPRVFRALPRLRPAHIRSQANNNWLITCRHFTCGVIFVAIVRIKYVNDRSGGGLSPRWGWSWSVSRLA